MKRQLYLPLLITLLASLVFGFFPLGQQIAYANPGLVSPTGHVANGWTDPGNAWDEDTGTFASYYVPKKGQWSPYLELTITEIQCDKVRVWSSRESADIDDMEVDVYYSEGWHNIHTGSITVDSFVEFAIGSTQAVTAMRVRYYNSNNGQAQFAYVNEADFNEVPPSISNSPDNYGFGVVAESSATGTGLDYFTVTNNSGYPVNITISATDMTGGVTWELSEDGSAGSDICGLKAGTPTLGDYTIAVPEETANTLVSNLSNVEPNNSQGWGLQLLAPTTFTDGGSKSGTVTLTATAV